MTVAKSTFLLPMAMLAVVALYAVPALAQTGRSTGDCNYRDGRGWVRCGDYPAQRSTPAPAQPDPEVIRQEQEAAKLRAEEQERERQREEERRRQEEFQRDRDQTAKSLKGHAASDPSLHGSTNAVSGLKSTTTTEALKTVNPSTGLKSGSVPPPTMKLAPFAIQSIQARGEFYIFTSDGRKLIGKNAAQVPIDNGARIVTGPTGHARLTLPDNTVFVVGVNTEMQIDEFVYDPNSTAAKLTASLIKGLFRLVTGKVARVNPESVKVKLAVADLGFRGTDCETTVAPDGSGHVKLFSGQLEITGHKMGSVFLLNAGQMVTFTADGTFSRPTTMKISYTPDATSTRSDRR